MKNKNIILFIILLTTFLRPALSEEKNITLKSFSLRASHKTIKQGDTVTVWIDSKKTLSSLKFWSFNKSFRYKKVHNKKQPHLFRSFIAIPATEKPGKKLIAIKAIDIYGKTTKMYLAITVKKANFDTDFIKLPKSKQKIVSNKQLIKEANVLVKKFNNNHFKRYVYNKFLWPVKGVISSKFGSQRRYNTGALAWIHKGLDIAAPIGTKIIATNSGKVLISKKMIIHGNTVMIDHGSGIKSIYNHMNKIYVKNNQYVKRGQYIGEVGNTGISTGPHLHYGISISNIRVNPEQWLNNKVKLY